MEAELYEVIVEIKTIVLYTSLALLLALGYLAGK